MKQNAFAIIVDDEKDIGTLLSAFLKNAGFTVKYAESLSEAEVIIKENDLKLALLDINLPDGSGFDLVDALRKNNPNVKIIVQSAYNGPEEKEKLDYHQLEHFLPKPINLTELKKLVS